MDDFWVLFSLICLDFMISVALIFIVFGEMRRLWDKVNAKDEENNAEHSD